MKHWSWLPKAGLAILLLVGTVGFASGQNLPTLKGKKVVATVNGEPITLDEFNRELALSHRNKAGKEDRLELLRRLINVRLIIQEGRRMGLDELREIEKMVDVFSRVTLREEVMERHVKGMKADEKEVDRVYRESVKEWKINSLFFEKEEDARKMEEEMKVGKDFDELSKQFVAAGKARAGEKGEYLKVKKIDPQIVDVVSKLETGSVSSVIPFKNGFVILKLEDIRFPEDLEVRNQARLEVLKRKKIQTLNDYTSALVKKYAKVYKKVLDGIDYESKTPGFEALLKDRRVIAEIKGEKPITVAELTENLKQEFYHGIEKAAESKKLNSRKGRVFEEMLYKRVLRGEALRLGLDKTESYKNKVSEYENLIIFGVFVQKAVAPDIKLGEEEVKTYYNEHIKDYTLPEMMRINSLVFAKRNYAEDAVEKLRKGTDFKWVSDNAEGQVDKNAKGVLIFEGNLLTTKDLPEGVQKAVSGARVGDFRLYESPEGLFYVLVIQEVIPSRPQRYEDAREDAAKKVFDEKLKMAAEEYADKLRAVSEVKIYLKEN
jgi:parvulin-like peptidyl-prolyl isomerase